MGWAAAILTAAQGYQSYAAQQNQYKYNQKMQGVIKSTAIRDATDTENALNLRGSQERDAAGQAGFENERNSLETRESAYTYQGEHGMVGLSADSILNDISRKEGENQTSITQNFENTMFQLSQEKRGAWLQAADKVASSPTMAPPDLLSSMLGLGAGGVNAYDMIQRRNQYSDPGNSGGGPG